MKTNRYIQFSETFEGVYRKGLDALRMVVGAVPTGARAAAIPTSSLTG